MRKILALFLVIAMVPFMTGCRVDGLWGYDDDESTPAAVNYNKISPVIKIPVDSTSGLLSSLKGTSPINLHCYVKATHARSLSGWLELDPVYTPPATEIYFKLPAGVELTADQLTLGTGNKMQFRFKTVKTDGTPVTVDVVAVAVTNAVAATSGSTSTYSYAILFDFDDSAAGTVKVSFTESATTSFTTDTFVNPTSTPETVAPTAIPVDTATTYTIATLLYSTDGTTYSNLSQDPSARTSFAMSDLKGMYFKVTFSDAITNTATATFSMTANNESSTAKTTISSLTNNGEATWAIDGKSVVIKVTGNVALIPGNYSLSLVSFTGVAGTKTLYTNPSAYFVVPQTQVTNITVNGTVYTSSVPVQDPSNLGKTTVVVTFDTAVQSVTGSVKLERFASSTSTTAEATYTITAADSTTFNATNKTMTLTFNQALVAAKYYKVTYVSGSIKDVNGNSVKEKSPIEFKTL